MDYNKNISLFKHYEHREAEYFISVADFCLGIYNGEFKKEVEAIRAETDNEKRKLLKKALPAATISGTFSPIRGKENLKEHSGFICLDLDAKSNPNITDWIEERDKLSHIKNVFFSALSVSGQGVFLIIPIENPEKHEAHFDALKRDFVKLGYVLDGSCRDVSRLRGISYDPGAKENLNAISYNRIYKPRKAPVRAYKSHTDDLGRLIDKIISSGIDLTNGYENWFEIGRALANEYGESGRGHFHRLSRRFHKYKESEADRQYNACLRSPGRASKGTIFHLAKEYGILLH